MWYDFYVCGDEVKLAQGQVEGNEPRIAILEAVRSVSDVLDDCTGALEPTVTVSRVDDGCFAGEIDTHGLGTIHVRIARTD